MEGFEEDTDFRRGKGTFEKVERAMRILREKRLPFGISCCYTSKNVEMIGSEAYFDQMIDWGARFCWFFTYMPVGKAAVPELMVTAEQRRFMYRQVRAFRETKPLFTLDFWNDGEYPKGCIVLEPGQRRHSPRGGRVHRQAPGQAVRLHRLQAGDGARAGLQGGAPMSPRQRERDRWQRDERVRAGHFTWWEYVLTILVLLALPVLPALVFSNTSVLQTTPVRFVVYYVVYCGLVAGLFCAITTWQKRILLDRPLQTLCDAARRVASGDFSVTITPPHPPEKADYMDVMFTDFNRMVAELGSIQTLKDDFVANVSHEIKTPLAVIRSYVEALESPGLSEETRRQYMATIVEATDKLSTLVSNILRLNKLENQKITARPEPYDLCRQLGDCVLGFEELWDRKRIEPMVDIEEQAMLNADAGMMELVWNNLLSNAIKFTPEGGLVTLR